VTAFHSEGTTHFDASAFTDDVNRQALTAYSVYSRNRFTGNWTSLLRLGATRDDLDTVGLFPSFFRTDQHQLTWQNDLTTGSGTFIGGLEYLGQRVDSNNAFSETERTVRSAFAGYQGAFGNHALQLNARRDDDSQFGGRNTGSIGYGYRFTPGFRVRANAGTAFKAPTFNDLYFPDFPPFFFSNPNLRPERSVSREVGADLDHGDHHLSVTLFDSRITDLITIFTDPVTFVSTTANLDNARIEGAELSYRALARGWRIQARLTVQDPRDEDTGAQLRRRAREFGAISAGRSFGPWRAAAEFVASGARYDSTVEAPASRMHGYALVNLVGSYSWSKEWSVNARWNNVFDRDYELAQFYNVPKSNLFAWVAWQPR
jgi:vitamin B12 transporter